MERLFVFADFNWLVRPELVGELCYEKLRGSDSYALKVLLFISYCSNCPFRIIVSVW